MGLSRVVISFNGTKNSSVRHVAARYKPLLRIFTRFGGHCGSARFSSMGLARREMARNEVIVNFSKQIATFQLSPVFSILSRGERERSFSIDFISQRAQKVNRETFRGFILKNREFLNTYFLLMSSLFNNNREIVVKGNGKFYCIKFKFV